MDISYYFFVAEDEFRDRMAALANNELFEGINYLEIRNNGKKLLESFDGFVLVTVSKDFNIQNTNLLKYLDNDLLYVSNDW